MIFTVQARLLAYAGVGVVAASEVTAEWQELCLKVGFLLLLSLLRLCTLIISAVGTVHTVNPTYLSLVVWGT